MGGYINYDLDGRNIRVPKEEIEHNMKLPCVKTEEDAIWIYLEDNGYIDNPEQEELDKKAKDNRITATIHEARADKPKTARKVERKPDETKESLISKLAETLGDMSNVTEVNIVNVGKLITFKLGNDTFKLDLIRQRQPKK